MERGHRLMDVFIDIQFVKRGRLPIKKYKSIDYLNFRRDSTNYYLIDQLKIPETYLNYELKDLCGEWFPFIEVNMNTYLKNTFDIDYEHFKQVLNSYFTEITGNRYVNIVDLEDYLTKHGIFINKTVNLRSKFNQINSYDYVRSNKVEIPSQSKVESPSQITVKCKPYLIDLNKDESDVDEHGRSNQSCCDNDEELKQKIKLKLNELNNIYFNNDDDLIKIDNGQSSVQGVCEPLPGYMSQDSHCTYSHINDGHLNDSHLNDNHIITEEIDLSYDSEDDNNGYNCNNCGDNLEIDI